MKQFYLRCFYFVAPLFILLLFLPLEKKQIFNSLENDCFGRSHWMYNRIYNNNTPIDILFLGSSHTINGINDELLQSQYPNFHFVNLGYCRLGRNLLYSLFHKILEEKKPKHLFLEIREREGRYSHPVFPHLASTKEVFTATPIFNKDLLRDWGQHLSNKVDLFQEAHFSPIVSIPLSQKEHGFGPSRDTASLQHLLEAKEHRQNKDYSMHEWEHQFHLQYPLFYLKKIIALCAKHDIKLHFVYLPGYGTPFSLPLELELYQSVGNTLIPPDAILKNTDYWADRDHINQAGANELTRWLSKEISIYLE